MKAVLSTTKHLRRRLFGMLFLVNLFVIGLFVSLNYHSMVEVIVLTLIGALVSTVCMSLLAAPFVVAWVVWRSASTKKTAQDRVKHD